MELELGKYQRSELLYRGLQGREVHRVYVNAEESYILKPNTPSSLEVWVYEHMLPFIPPVYPKLLDYSPCGISGQAAMGWLLFEDLGPLRHEYNEAWALEVVRLTAKWHALPTEPWLQASASLAGHKPDYAAMITDLLTSKLDLLSLAPSLGIEASLIHLLYVLIEQEQLTSEQVLSHGDLHVGNYTFTRGQLYILDWEHAHLNNRYWDLFHIIDLSHPLYPKNKAPNWRKLLLDTYIQEAVRLGSSIDPTRFIYEYHLFSAVFSLWMLRLIAADRLRDNSPWSDEQLNQQDIEVALTFSETAAGL
jgi:hypothetical protein